ncbi:hypothetical protein V8E51_014003 [Hyaloscypha variabilis]
MCFGTTITCNECKTPTVYLLPGIHRCSTRNTLAHTITGPTTTCTTCWFCRATPESLDNPLAEAGTVMAWNEQAHKLFGFNNELWEARGNIKELASQIERFATPEEFEYDSEEDDVGDEIDRLIGLKKAEEAKVQELEGVRDRFFRVSGHGTGPYIVIAPPGIGERAPFSFQEWTSRFANAGELESEMLNLDCRGYEEYLETYGFEYECDQFHATNTERYEMDRKVFRFEDVKEARMGFRSWRSMDRLRAIEQNVTPRTVAESFEFTLDLYARYLRDCPRDAKVFHDWRNTVATGQRRHLYGLECSYFEEVEAPIADTPAPEMAGPVEVPLTFAEWCVSPLVPADREFNRNTDSALRADLFGYQHYLFRFPETAPVYEKHRELCARLSLAYVEDFESRTTNSASQPLSLRDFARSLKEQGYRTSTLTWEVDAYLLYLGSVADAAEVGGFTMARDWWARGDRRELEGLPRHDPVTTKLKSWLHIRTAVRDTELLIESLRALPEQVRARALEGPDPAYVPGSPFEDVRIVERDAARDDRIDDDDRDDAHHDSEDDGVDEDPFLDWILRQPHPPPMHPAHIPHRDHFAGNFDPFDPFGQRPTLHRHDEIEVEGDDFDRLFDEDHQTVNPPIIPGEDFDDEDSSDDEEFDELLDPLSVHEMRMAMEDLQTLVGNVEGSDEEE